jgi:hypothetical protein
MTMFGYFSTRVGFGVLAILGLMIVSFTPFSGPHAQSRDAVVECDGGLLVWSQPSGNRYLIFFKGTGKFRSLDVEANFGRKVLFGVQGKGRNQIHADTKSGSVRCRYH